MISNRDDCDIVLIRLNDAIVTSGKYKDKTISRNTLARFFPGIKTGNQLVIENRLLKGLIGE